MSAKVNQGRWTAEIDGDFVVFLIGARPSLRHLPSSVRDLGGLRGMKGMLDYLTERPDKGLLGYQLGFPTIVQYWRSFEHLEAFAKDQDDPHLAAWRTYWKRVGTTDAPGSGTRPTSSTPTNTKPSTAICPPSDSPQPAEPSPSPNQ